MASSYELLAERVLGPLVPDRACGDCTACCTALFVDGGDWTKPADTPCLHCLDQGCGIYARRPEPCRLFHCAWRRIGGLPDVLRPDRCGAIIMLEADRAAANPFARLCLVARWLDEAPLLEGARADHLLTLFRRGNLPLWFSPMATTRRILVHPSQAVYRHVTEGLAASGALAAEVARWRSMLPPRLPVQ